MSKKLGYKVQKTSDLFFGLRNATVFGRLEPYGFNAEELDKGWRLLADVKERRLARVLGQQVGRSNEFEKFEAFSSHWLAVLKAAFTSHHQTAGRELLFSLSPQRGRAAVMIVGTFLVRLGKLDPEVREYLRSRGLSDEVVADVAGEFKRVSALKEAPTGALGFDDESLERAEKEMWDWYLEWSAIVRQVITDGNVLRMLGFKKRKGGRPRKVEAAKG